MLHLRTMQGDIYNGRMINSHAHGMVPLPLILSCPNHLKSSLFYVVGLCSYLWTVEAIFTIVRLLQAFSYGIFV